MSESPNVDHDPALIDAARHIANAYRAIHTIPSSLSNEEKSERVDTAWRRAGTDTLNSPYAQSVSWVEGAWYYAQEQREIFSEDVKTKDWFPQALGEAKAFLHDLFFIRIGTRFEPASTADKSIEQVPDAVLKHLGSYRGPNDPRLATLSLEGIIEQVIQKPNALLYIKDD